MIKKRPFFSTTFYTISGRSLGVLIPFFIAMTYGASPATDAFFFSYGLIFSLIGIFTHLFEAALIPYLTEEKQVPENVFGFANGVLFLSLPGILCLCLLIGGLLAPALIRWSAWTEVSAGLAARLFLEMVPFLLFSVWISAANGVFYVQNIFWFPAVSPLIRSASVTLFIFGLSAAFGIHALTGGFVIGEIVRWLLVLIVLVRLTKWRLVLPWRRLGKRIIIFFRQTSFQLLALVAMSLLVIVDQWFGALLGHGNLSLFNYADRVIQVPYILFLSAFLQIYLSDWSDTYYFESASVFWPRVRRDIRTVFVVSLALAAGVWYLREPLIYAVFGRGKFSPMELDTLAEVCGWLAISFVPGVIRLVYGRVLFVMKKSIFYCIQTWIELGAKIILNYIFIRRYSVVGIAMSTACVYSLTALWLHFYLKRHRDEAVLIK